MKRFIDSFRSFLISYYRLATQDFLYQRGDGFSILKNASLLKEAFSSEPVGLHIAKLLAAQGSLDTKEEGRVQDLAKK